jgi:CheY-like chemotaxis protein
MPRRVLVVEDDADSREVMVLFLARAGHEVSGAATGRAAIDQAVRDRPDIALIDLGLPDVDGCEVARALRAQLGSATRLVALTGSSEPQDVDRVRGAGFDAHLVKPVDPEKLRRMVASSETTG